MIDLETEPLEELEEDYKVFKEAVERLEKRYGEISRDIVRILKRYYVEHLGVEIAHRKRMAITR